MKKTLSFWIFLLTAFVIVGILCSTLFSAYLVTRENLVNHSLEINRVYSEKLAQVTDEVFTSMKQILEQREFDVVHDIDKPEIIDGKLERFLKSSQNFNSLAVVNREGVILSATPYVGFEGETLTSLGAVESLKQKTTLITAPYTAITNRLILMVSTPLWGSDREYLGFLAGTIYLQEENIIKTILGEHYAKDGSYVYVVDKSGTLIYHPDVNRIGEKVEDNEVIEQLMNGQSGAQFVTNSKGIDFLAGYTYIPSSQWGVVSQTPYEVAVAPVGDMVKKIFMYSIPFVLFFIMITIFLTRKLAAPLRKLALFALNYSSDSEGQVKPPIATWYFEAEQLNKTLESFAKKQEKSIHNYKMKSLTDPLTGLANRRHLEETLEKWKSEKGHFSLIVIDIDYFKKVNDEFGHQIGDEVLIFLSTKMREFIRADDVCARFGGEEFVVLLSETNAVEAMKIAERMRETISHTISPTGRSITFSLGVGTYDDNEDISSFFRRVDHALYEAKKEGRNKAVLSRP
ncbi:sensor domain-containing diguanylate cyclase [Halalkalibacter alkalisediminis]|uniref:Sensor domain-containing diguanylate cyclase n=1 Tax=Halalkalibacter alkalisediminis TaxID=935616 RepID=A0ABV6NEI5_9BACI|nr:sensor domain-containing diguanylate cyclase [Halalkalibacter alkalisediminis]